MKKFLRTLMLAAAMLLPFASHAQSTVSIGDGGTTNNQYLPGYNYYNYSFTQQIYTSDEIGVAGTITSISFKNTGAEKTRYYNVYLSHTNAESFVSGGDWIAVSESDKVFTGSVTFTVGEWTTIEFDTPFSYDGTSNLLVSVADSTGNWSSSPHMACLVFDATSQAIRAYRDDNPYDISAPGVAGTVLTVKNQIELDIIPSGGQFCEKPATLTVTNVTAHEASFVWNSTTAGIYQFESKLASDTIWDEWTPQSDTTFTLYNLQQNSAYNVRVKAICDVDLESGYKTANFTTLISCPTPTGLAAVLTPGDGTIATLNWTENGTATEWEVLYSTDADFTGVSPMTVTGVPNAPLTGLTAESVYYAKVRAICDVDDESSWSNTITFTPTDAYSVTVNDGTTTNGYVPIYGFYCDDHTKSQFIIPATDLASMQGGVITKLTFYSSNASVAWGNAEFEVYMTETSDNTLTALQDVTSMALVKSSGSLSIVDNIMEVYLTTPYLYSGSNLLVAFEQPVTGSYVSCNWYGVSAESGASWGGYGSSSVSAKTFLPKVTFDFTPGTGDICYPVTGLTASNVESTSISLSWLDNNNDVATYTVYDLSDTTVIATNLTTTNYTVTGLTPSTGYTFGVVANCSATNESMIMSVTAATACGNGNCDIYVYAQDSYGDGWNGATITFMQEGLAVDSYTMAGQSVSNTVIYDTAAVSVCAGIPISLNWTTGAWDSEITLSIANSLGEVVFTAAGTDVSGEFLVLDSCNAAAPEIIPDTLVLTIAVNDATMGTTSPVPGSYTLVTGDEITISAIPNEGYELVGWVEYFTLEGEIYADTITSDDDEFDDVLDLYVSENSASFLDTLTLVALFDVATVAEPDTLVLTIAVNDATMGTTSPVPGTYTYVTGDIVNIEAIANEGYQLAAWAFTRMTDNGVIESDTVFSNEEGFINPIGGELTDPSGMYLVATITALFDVATVIEHDTLVLTLAVNDATMGTTSPVPGNYTLVTGDEITISAIPNEGYELVGWAEYLTLGGVIYADTITSDDDVFDDVFDLYVSEDIASLLDTFTLVALFDVASTQPVDCPDSVAIPFVEGFENGIDCWTMVNTESGTGAIVEQSYAYQDSSFFAFKYNTNPPQYLITPRLAGTGSSLQVEFYYRVMSTTYPESFQIGYSTTTNDTSAFVWSNEQTNLTNTTYQHYVEVLNVAGIKYVAIRYTANDQWYLYVDNFIARDVPTCADITDLTVTATTGTSITLSWSDANNSGATYTVYDMADNTVIASGITTTNYTVTGLEGLTDYTFGVVANCSATDASLPVIVTGRTDIVCSGSTCQITIVGTDEYGDGWNGAAIDIALGNNLVGEFTLENGDTNIVSYTVCSGMPITFSWITGSWDSETSFDIINANNQIVYTGSGSGLSGEFLTLDSCSATEATVILDSMLVNISVNDATMGTTIPAPGSHYLMEGDTLSVIAVPATGYLLEGWYVKVTQNGQVAGIDDTVYTTISNVGDLFTEPLVVQHGYGSYVFYVTALFAPAPTCPAVTDLAATANTANSVTVSWNGTAANYSLYQDGAYVANVPANATAMVNTYTFTGLSAATSYTFGVIAVCSATDSSEIATVVASTECGDITTLPYNEGFENGLGCWSSVNNSTDGVDWSVISSIGTSVAPHTGNGMASSWSWNSNAMHADAWLISPKFILPNTTEGLTFSWWDNTNDGYPDSYSVVLSTTTDDITAFTTTVRPYATASDDWTMNTIDLSAYAGQSVYIAFHHVDYDANYLVIDDISLFEGTYIPPAPDTLTVTFAVNNATMGTTNPAPGTYQYLTGETVHFNAIANPGYHFVGWEWLVDGEADTLDANYISASFPVNTFIDYGSMTFTALFEAGNPDSTTITYAVNDATMGTTVPAPGTYSIYVGNNIEAAAVPNNGYALAAWVLEIYMDGETYSSDTLMYGDEGFENPIDFGILSQNFIDYEASLGVTAIFAPDTFAVEEYITLITAVNDPTMGTMTPAPGVHQYAVGETVHFSVTPNAGYHYESVNVALLFMDVPMFDTTITDDISEIDLEVEEEMVGFTLSITVNFAPNSQTDAVLNVSVNDANGGYVLVNGHQTSSYTGQLGETVALEAVANEGFRFERWSDGNTNATRTIVLEEPLTTISAVFVENDGIDVAGKLDDLKVYPNPTHGAVTIDAEDVIKVEVMDLNGRVAATFENSNRFDISNLSAGTYVVRIQTTNGIAVRRIVKK